MDGLDVSRLSPTDLTAALRSFPRRYREALAVEPEEDLDELLRRGRAEARPLADELVDAICTLTVVQRALGEIIRSEQPVLHPSVVDPTLRDWAPPPGLDAPTLLEMFEDVANGLAADVERVPSVDWERTGRVADGPAVGAIDVVREGVRVAANAQRELARGMRSLRE